MVVVGFYSWVVLYSGDLVWLLWFVKGFVSTLVCGLGFCEEISKTVISSRLRSQGKTVVPISGFHQLR